MEIEESAKVENMGFDDFKSKILKHFPGFRFIQFVGGYKLFTSHGIEISWFSDAHIGSCLCWKTEYDHIMRKVYI